MSDRVIDEGTIPRPHREESELRWKVAVLVLCALFAAHVWHLRFVGDDGAILWRYAKHFAEGHGFRYNIEDDPVEGCSEIPFALLVSLAFPLGIEPDVFCKGLGLILGPLSLFLAFVLGRRAGLSPPLAFVATLALAVNHSFAAWATGGLGTRFNTIFVLLVLSRFLREESDPKASPLLSALGFGWLAMTRPEGMIFFALAFVWRTMQGRPFSQLAKYAALFSIIKLAQLAFQLVYFGSPLPNTFYAKVNGLWIERGLLYFESFAIVYSMWIVVPLALLGCLRGGRGNASACRFLLFTAFGFGACIGAIGGDRFEFRMLDPILPALYVCAAAGAGWLMSAVRNSPRFWSALACTLLVVSSAGATVLRRNRAFYRLDLEDVEYIQAGFDWARRTALIYKRHLPPGTRITQGNAGAIPFYSGFYSLDSFGLNDPVIARRPIRGRGVYAHEQTPVQEDFDRARVDYTHLSVFREHPIEYMARLQGIPRRFLQGLDLKQDSIPEPLRSFLPTEYALCVKLEDSLYLFARTRLPAESYRRQWRERGYVVLF